MDGGLERARRGGGETHGGMAAPETAQPASARWESASGKVPVN